MTRSDRFEVQEMSTSTLAFIQRILQEGLPLFEEIKHLDSRQRKALLHEVKRELSLRSRQDAKRPSSSGWTQSWTR